jgi:hypothetical protein
MKTWANELTEPFQWKKSNGQKTHEEMLTIPDHKGNVNQNHIETSSHSRENGSIINTNTNKRW